MTTSLQDYGFVFKEYTRFLGKELVAGHVYEHKAHNADRPIYLFWPYTMMAETTAVIADGPLVEGGFIYATLNVKAHDAYTYNALSSLATEAAKGNLGTRNRPIYNPTQHYLAIKLSKNGEYSKVFYSDPKTHLDLIALYNSRCTPFNGNLTVHSGYRNKCEVGFINKDFGLLFPTENEAFVKCPEVR